MTSGRSPVVRAPNGETRGDVGAILPLVLVVAVILSMVVIALARFATTDLRYARVTEERAERQAAAIGAITYGVERIRLRQTLCGTAAEDVGFVTSGLIDRNGTTTTLTCERIGGVAGEITGWSLILTGLGAGGQPRLSVGGGGTKAISGSAFIDDVNRVALPGGTVLRHDDGDLWHTRVSCPGGAVTLPAGYTFHPAVARGPLCTTRQWGEVAATPSLPDLSALPPKAATDFVLSGGCRVFAPGRYEDPPQIPLLGHAYFQSGLYHFDDIGAWVIEQQTVWFGHPGSLGEELANPDCHAARDADPNLGGVGAVAYFGGDSRLRIAPGGSIELFPRSIGGRPLSFQELEPASPYPASTITAASGQRLAYVLSGSVADFVAHGRVHAPRAWFELANTAVDAEQRLLGGTTLARLSITAASGATGLEIAPADTPVESEILLTATAESDVSKVTTEVQAVVQYRAAAADPADRVAVRSLRVLD